LFGADLADSVGILLLVLLAAATLALLWERKR
jgi:hypothetical protein